MDVALDLLEPLHPISCRALQLERFNFALFLIFLQCARNSHRRLKVRQHACECDCVFHRQLRTRADAEMRGMRGVADEADGLLLKPVETTNAD